MPTIDLSTMPIKTANEVIKGYGAVHKDVDIINPDARHYIAVGLTNPVTVRIRGSAGYFCGGLTDGPVIAVDKNVSWGVGDNMLSGAIVVGGNAGAIAGEALRGGEIVIKGNMGSRAGQVMKRGTLCCAGNSSFMAGYMMYGGRMIILGDSGARVGENMAGGEIFVGGTVESLGSDAKEADTTAEDLESVRAFLEKYGLAFSGRFKKIVSAGQDLKYARPEPKTKRTPFVAFSGNGAPYWNDKVCQDIQVKSAIGRYRIRGYGTARHLPHFTDLVFKKDLSAAIAKAAADPELLDKVNLRTFIGGKHGGRALDLSMPVMIAPMSFGAVSPPVKTALGIASRLSGISENTGEGGMYSVERAEARQLIAQCLSGRLGWNIHDMKRADGLELYISQGAKPGLGGQLMASKLTKEIADIRGIPAGMDLRSPSRHPDILGGDDLIMKVQELREAVGWRLPVSLKLGGGRTRDDVKITLKDGLDFIELDGLQGGTGAAGDEVVEHVGIPTLSALMEALDGLSELDADGALPIVLMGGIQNGVDAAKAIAMGATAVGLGTGMLIAAGCTGCMNCSSGDCSVGIATQNPELVKRFGVEKMANRMHRYLESIRWQLAAVTRALGYDDVRKLSRDDLVALTPEAAAMTRLPQAPCSRSARSFVETKGANGGRETGTANFTQKDRRAIQSMAAEGADTPENRKTVLADLLVPRDNPFPEGRPAALDDLVFLSAALTRLVIDPYREECRTTTRLSRTIPIGPYAPDAPAITLARPFLATGFDAASPAVRRAAAAALAETGCGYLGRKPPEGEARPAWFQLVLPGDAPSPEAAGLIYAADERSTPNGVRRLRTDQLLGVSLTGKALADAVPIALESQWDLLLLDGASGLGTPWPELAGPPDFTVLRDALRILKSMNREEEIALVYFGGLRTGTDVAKVLALNAMAGVFGAALAAAMGGRISVGDMVFPNELTEATMTSAAVRWIQAVTQETAIIARCTGKTNVHNLEPEDMKTITLAASAAFDIPLASGQVKRTRF